MVNILDGTREFMRLAGQNTEGGDFMADAARSLRLRLMAEEFEEYVLAEERDDIVEAVDGLLDIIVVAWGTLLTYLGEVKTFEAANEVTRSNLDKFRGGVRKDADGKVLKPEGWTPPDIEGVIYG